MSCSLGKLAPPWALTQITHSLLDIRHRRGSQACGTILKKQQITLSQSLLSLHWKPESESPGADLLIVPRQMQVQVDVGETPYESLSEGSLLGLHLSKNTD